MAKPDYDSGENAELCIIWTSLILLFIFCFKMIILSYSCIQNDPKENTFLIIYLKTLKYYSCKQNTDVRRLNSDMILDVPL